MRQIEGLTLTKIGEPLIAKEKGYGYYKLYIQAANHNLFAKGGARTIFVYLLFQSQNNRFKIVKKTVTANCSGENNYKKYMEQLEESNFIVINDEKRTLAINYEYINKIILSNPDLYRINFPEIDNYYDSEYEVKVLNYGKFSDKQDLSKEEIVFLLNLIENDKNKVFCSKEKREMVSELADKGYVRFDGKIIFVDFGE